MDDGTDANATPSTPKQSRSSSPTVAAADGDGNNNDDDDEGPKLVRKLSAKEEAAAAILPERRFGVSVAGDRKRLRRMLSGSSTDDNRSPPKKGRGGADTGGAGAGVELDVYGARFSTKIHTRGCHRVYRLLLRLKREQACDQWHSSRASTFLPVHTVNCVQTLKDEVASVSLPIL
jgi:hypothetical protein